MSAARLWADTEQLAIEGYFLLADRPDCLTTVQFNARPNVAAWAAPQSMAYGEDNVIKTCTTLCVWQPVALASADLLAADVTVKRVRRSLTTKPCLSSYLWRVVRQLAVPSHSIDSAATLRAAPCIPDHDAYHNVTGTILHLMQTSGCFTDMNVKSILTSILTQILIQSSTGLVAKMHHLTSIFSY